MPLDDATEGVIPLPDEGPICGAVVVAPPPPKARHSCPAPASRTAARGPSGSADPAPGVEPVPVPICPGGIAEPVLGGPLLADPAPVPLNDDNEIIGAPVAPQPAAQKQNRTIWEWHPGLTFGTFVSYHTPVKKGWHAIPKL